MGLAEIFTKAILNTLLGMGTVFSVLIFISFIISLLKYLPGLLERFQLKKANNGEPKSLSEELIPNSAIEDGGGIITAVIAAALASSMSSKKASSDDYFVRTIKRL